MRLHIALKMTPPEAVPTEGLRDWIDRAGRAVAEVRGFVTLSLAELEEQTPAEREALALGFAGGEEPIADFDELESQLSALRAELEGQVEQMTAAAEPVEAPP